MVLGCRDTRLEVEFGDDNLSVVQCGVNRWEAAWGGHRRAAPPHGEAAVSKTAWCSSPGSENYCGHTLDFLFAFYLLVFRLLYHSQCLLSTCNKADL